MPRLLSAKTLLLGGLAAAAAAGALKNRGKVAGLLGRSSSEPPPAPPSAEHEARTQPSPTPTPSNYDTSGPPANTATAVATPHTGEREPVDEAAEIAAAAAEAAAIGGATPDYPGREMHSVADEADRPLMESGEGESEGQELTEADLEAILDANAAESDPATGLSGVDLPHEDVAAELAVGEGLVDEDLVAGTGTAEAAAADLQAGHTLPPEPPLPGDGDTSTHADWAPTPSQELDSDRPAFGEPADATADRDAPADVSAASAATGDSQAADELAASAETLVTPAIKPSPPAEPAAAPEDRDQIPSSGSTIETDLGEWAPPDAAEAIDTRSETRNEGTLDPGAPGGETGEWETWSGGKSQP